MKLTDELKNKIDEFFDNKTEEELQYIADKYQALQLQQTDVMQRYFHPFVGAGTLIKETEKSLVIKLNFNGKEYFAPKHEFTKLL